MSKYFYHGLRTGLVVDTMLEIFKSGGIKSKRLRGSSSTQGYNGADYVSLCRKGDSTEYQESKNNSFYSYILNRFCFIIKDDIPAIKPRFVNIQDDYERFDLMMYMNQHPEERITDMFDEWQVKDEVPISSIIGIGLPLKWISQPDEFGYSLFYDLDSLRNRLLQIIKIAHALGLDIVDSSLPNFIEEYEISKEQNKNIEFKLNI